MYYSSTGFDVGLDTTFMLPYDLANLTTQLLKYHKVHKVDYHQKTGVHALPLASLAAQ